MEIGEVSHVAVELFTVPAGQRLVITSAAVGTGLNECPFTLNPRISLPDAGNAFPLGEVSPSIRGLNPVRYINQTTYPVTIYVGAEELVRFDAFRSDGTCSALVRVSITGYLEDDI